MSAKTPPKDSSKDSPEDRPDFIPDDVSPSDLTIGASPDSDIVLAQRTFTDDALSAITSLQDAFNALASQGLDIVDASEELGNGFVLTKNKRQFVGKPFLLLQWSFYPGDFGPDSEYVAGYIVTENGERFVITDGSTGLCADLRKWTDNNNGRMAGMLCKGGLTVSDYKNCDDCKTANSKGAAQCTKCNSLNLKPAETFYIA